ncbi:MAG: carbohydrate kinase [Lachnospiraceae bacterium]|nr:carbohydrate kinase [Lachnospiraceae bacterium]
MYDVVSIGEMVIDFLPGQEKGSYIRNAGGAPANVAIAAVRNGLKSGIYCKVGADDFGRFLLNTLKEEGVEALCPRMTDKAITTMAFVSLDENGERSFTFSRKPGADMMLESSEISRDLLLDTKLVHGGSFSLSEGNAREATIYTLKTAHGLGKLVSFDINYRNVAWKDDRDRCAREVMGILPYVDLLKVSDEEIDMIGGRTAIPQLMKDKQLTVIVETLGADGAECFFNGGSIRHPGYGVEKDKIADTTGAGDAFWGGFLSRLLILGAAKAEDIGEGYLKDALDYGNISGSLCVRAKGAISSLPNRAEIEAFRKEFGKL